MNKISSVLRPRSVVVVGASQNPAKRGHHAVRTLLASFDGKVFAVNSGGGEVLGLTAYRTVQELPEVPDLAFITTPAATVPQILRDCSQKGVAGAVVSAVGFRESGDQGAALEREIAEVVRESGIRLVGPNTSGMVNTAIGLNLVGIQDLPTGSLALLSQSGNVALDVINGAKRWGAGISVYVGVGNETDIAFHEYLEFLAEDPNTKAIMMYVEGFREGRKFIEVARRVSSVKPVVFLKGGRTDRGVAAARSHTGAIAGSYPVLRAALRQGGVSEARRSDELLPVAYALAHQPPIPPGTDVAVLSDGGGHGTLSADALGDLGVTIAGLSDDTRHRLRQLLGSAAAVDNPVDVAGAGDNNPMIFAEAIEILVSDPSVGGIMLVGLFGGYAIRFSPQLAEVELQAAQKMADVVEQSGKALVVHSLYAFRQPEPLLVLARNGVSVVESIEVGCRCIRALQARGLHLQQAPVPLSGVFPRQVQSAGIAAARREGRASLMETEVRELIAEYNVLVADGKICRSADEAATVIAEAGVPCAMKIVSPAISHKTDAGGVILNVKDSDEGRTKFAQILTSASEYAVARGFVPDVRGVLVMPMQPTPIAELIVGVRRDPDFGPMLTVGAGGIAVEIHHDTALRGLPIGRIEALEMLSEIRIARLLDGFRGKPPANREALADVILGIAACALAHPEIDEIEANPVFAFEDRAVVVDARAFLTVVDRSPDEVPEDRHVPAV